MIRLNLLPSQEKKDLETAEINRWSAFFSSWLLILLIIFILLCLSAYFYLFILVKAQNGLIEDEERHIKTQELEQLEKQIGRANQKISQVYNLSKDLKRLMPTLEEFTGLAPQGIYLTNFSYQKDLQRVNLNGHAQNRNQLLVFQKKLEENSQFTDIDSPISNLLKQEDIDFNLTFKISQ